MHTLPMACSTKMSRKGDIFSGKKIAVAVATVLASIPSAFAFEVDTGSDFKVRWDNTFKYSTAMRLKDRSNLLVSDPTLDDGDRAFKKGIISNRVDWLTELDVSFQNFGARLSGAAWYDDVYNHSNDNNSPLTVNAVSVSPNQFTKETRDLHGRKAELLDAFVYGKFSAGDTRTTLRGGRHSFLYGESLFFGNNGIAGGMAPIDVIKAQSVPNTQFKELLRPVPQVSFQTQLNSNWAVGGYYQTEWDAHRLPGVDSYFGFNDLVGAGGERIIAGFVPGLGPVASFYRGGDVNAKDSGQGGFQLRYRPDGGNADYGFYLIRYHDKAPQVYVRPTVGVGPGSPADMIGQYSLVYPENITAVGASFSTTLGTANVAGEISFRDNAPLVSHTGVVLPIPGFLADNNDHPLYAVGRTAHAQVSMINVLEKNALWQSATFIGEVAWNRTLSITKNPEALDPNTTRDALGIRFVLEPAYYQVLDGLDISVPIGVGYTPYGRSSAVGGFGVENGGDLSVGINGDYLKVWKISANYTHYYGKAQLLSNTATDVRYFGQMLADRDFVSLSVSRTF